MHELLVLVLAAETAREAKGSEDGKSSDNHFLWFAGMLVKRVQAAGSAAWLDW